MLFNVHQNVHQAVIIDVSLVRAIAEHQGFLSPENARALEHQVARTQADLDRLRQDRPEWRTEVDAAIQAFNDSDITGAKAAFARIDALMAERRADLRAEERELRLEEARSKNAQATLFYPFEFSRSEPLLTEAAELAETDIWYWIECGRARTAIGSLERALAAFQKAYDLAHDGVETRDHVAALDGIGDVRVAQGQLGAGLTAYEEGLGIRRRLAALDPGNARWARDILVSLRKTAQADQANASEYWSEVVVHMEAMKAKCILLLGDQPLLEIARQNLKTARQ